MKKTIIAFLCFIFLCLDILVVPATARSQAIKKGFYKVEELINITPDTLYTVQNISFNERIYMLIFDSSALPLQGIRLKPQSPKYNLIPLQPGYKFVLIGEGELVISS